jgi:superfamily II DNA or RNA helicase
LGKQKIDFVIIDEIHYVKVRGGRSSLTKEVRFTDRMVSQRHKNLVGLMTEIREQNKDVRVLGMTATPVINDLMEGRSLIDLVTGREYEDVSTNPTTPNANMLYEKFQLMSVREMPDYHISVNMNEIQVDAYTEESIDMLLSQQQSRLEQILTDARIPEIMNCIEAGKDANGNKTIIFTGYVTGIVDKLATAVSKAGYTYALYTGSLEEPDRLRELDRFCNGDADVLIASKPIAQGIDGLQKVCNNLIINTLPWTNAEYSN